jgi:hypothetical protein
MAAIVKGDKVHIYGAGVTITNGRVRSFSWDNAFANSATLEDENGNIVEERMDDLATDATLDFVPNEDYDDDKLPGANVDITNAAFVDKTAGTQRFFIQSVGGKRGAKEYTVVTLKLRKTQYVALDAP